MGTVGTAQHPWVLHSTRGYCTVPVGTVGTVGTARGKSDSWVRASTVGTVGTAGVYCRVLQVCTAGCIES
jgi:hypothetical protein